MLGLNKVIKSMDAFPISECKREGRVWENVTNFEVFYPSLNFKSAFAKIATTNRLAV